MKEEQTYIKWESWIANSHGKQCANFMASERPNWNEKLHSVGLAAYQYLYLYIYLYMYICIQI
jgi:hypothetical protein